MDKAVHPERSGPKWPVRKSLRAEHACKKTTKADKNYTAGSTETVMSHCIILEAQGPGRQPRTIYADRRRAGKISLLIAER
jgi:hypothetical protein